MSATSESTRRPQARSGSEGAALVWLDAMVIGICTPEAFLSAMRDIYKEGDEEGWEVLSLIDQYYRRGKIKLELFQWLKTRLGNLALGGPDPDLDTPTLRPQAAAPRAAAAPATRPIAAQAADTAVPQAAAAAARAASSAPPASFVQKPVAAPAAGAVARPAPPAPAIAPVAPLRPREVATGDVLRERYLLRTALGSSSSGTVFEAVDQYRLDWPSTSQGVAIKVLHPGVAGNEESLNELQRQFQHMQLLSHPHIVRAFEFDRDGEVAFFSMELLRGVLLSRVLNARIGVALPRAFALCIMRDVGAAMAYAHSRGILHGDLNPQNVFITNEGELRVLDFGVSYKLLQDRWAQDLELAKRAPVAAPGYASVQLLEGQQPDARDDVFALACLSYVLLSGVHPFPSLSAVEAFAQGSRPRRPPNLSSAQWRVLREGLHWDRERRPADVRRWLSRFDFSGAAPRLPSLSALVNAASAAKGSWPVMLGAVSADRRSPAPAAYWANTDYDSLAQRIAGWSALLRSSADTRAEPRRAGSARGARKPAPAAAAPSQRPCASHGRPAPSPSAASQRRSNPLASAKADCRSPCARNHQRDGGAQRTAARCEDRTCSRYRGRCRGRCARRCHCSAHRQHPRRGDFYLVDRVRDGKTHGRISAPIVPRVEHFEDGRNSMHLSIPLSGNPRTQAKSFYVVIDRSEDRRRLWASAR